MKEYRIIYTATFDTVEARDKAYDSLKTVVLSTASKAATYKRADMTKDEYEVHTPPVSEKVI